MMGPGYIYFMGMLMYIGCILFLNILFWVLPKSSSKMYYISIGSIAITGPFFLLLLKTPPPTSDAAFFYSMTAYFTVLNGLYGFFYHYFYVKK